MTQIIVKANMCSILSWEKITEEKEEVRVNIMVKKIKTRMVVKCLWYFSLSVGVEGKWVYRSLQYHRKGRKEGSILVLQTLPPHIHLSMNENTLWCCQFLSKQSQSSFLGAQTPRIYTDRSSLHGNRKKLCVCIAVAVRLNKFNQLFYFILQHFTRSIVRHRPKG